MVAFGRPLWQRKLIVKMWPGRHLLARMTNWPLIGHLLRMALFEGDYLTFLPSEEALRKREKVVIPGMVLDHFIEKAGFRFLMDVCICRDANGCDKYPTDIGCLFLGEAARGINPALGRPVSVEEAKAFQRRSEQAGLINLVGKNRLDQVWLGVEPVERLLTVCHCCECCCLWKLLTVLSDSITSMVHKLEGVEVSVSELCDGCGTCLGHCFAGALSLEGGSALVDQELCRGCGRCVLKCKREAIVLTFQENDYFQKCLDLIGRVEQRVDIGSSLPDKKSGRLPDRA